MSKEISDPTIYNTSQNKPMSSVLDAELSRRGILQGGFGLAAMGFLSGMGLAGCKLNSSDDDDVTPPAELKLGFDSIPGAKLDAVAVAAGYSAQVLAPWGTPLNSQANPWKNDGSNTSQDQLNAVGMHHDGMHFFPLNGSDTEGLLCINHEYIDQSALHPNGATEVAGKRSTEEVRKEINAHGISVVHIRLVDGVWDVVTDSSYNRRITSATEMDVTGPIAGSGLLVTKYTTGRGVENIARGTNNNCGNGYTPWGTYLTCEENWPYVFVNKGTQDTGQARMGIPTSATRYGWETADNGLYDEFARFDVTPSGANATEDFRNEANGHGYIVEIDPYNPASRPVKRTALGRFRHEDVTFGKLEKGKPVVFYTGHDGRFEYIYKYVSTKLWDPADASRTDRLRVGSEYMDDGILFVARFNEEGKGSWIPLLESTVTTSGQTLKEVVGSQAEIILNCPWAGDAVGATPMDRPEWTAVDPATGLVYVTLTNNTNRTDANTPNPRTNNKFGHIIRWQEGAVATEFTWDFFVFGSPASGDSVTNRSGLTARNEFASPDGLAFDSRGILWVQTDNGAEEVAENTNDQMLAVIPSRLNKADSGEPVIDGSNQDQLRRFFVGPNGCEVTGLAFTGDNKNFFVNIQHPSNWPYSINAAEETPAGVSVRPRASTVVIMKNDGGEIGV
ncbi:PhoX family phosphatase [Endozoicomonas gorgoniicola]|uniref:PhoX family phosphatase n=1 Tax=Endozoicomonas gorgoniicola TaxID=1234144 RepID=A0ABT3N0H6_9GAMM|nr:PhoX family phosphatase [Endozoicomonas gorgoniicola]MCW7555127.1 PhoX family phosphatase [Endozoicomonas gorgoniicola]